MTVSKSGPSNHRHSQRSWCVYCGTRLSPLPHKQGQPKRGTDANVRSRDHIVPVSVGGRITVPCCRWCNGRKGDTSLESWLRSAALAGRRSDVAALGEAEPLHENTLRALQAEDVTRIYRALANMGYKP